MATLADELLADLEDEEEDIEDELTMTAEVKEKVHQFYKTSFCTVIAGKFTLGY